MAAAKESPLAMVALSPEEEPAIKAYRESQEALRKALEARERPLFDPTLLAMAQGFLAPTKSGSFGESISNVAAKVGPVQEEEQKRAVEMAQIRSQLAAQELQQTRRGQILKEAAEQGGQGTINVNGQQFPSWFATLTPEKALRISLGDPEMGKQISDYLKLKEAMVKTQPGGVVTVDPSKPGGFTYTPFGGKTLTERFVPGAGTIKMTEQDAIKFDAAREALRENPDNTEAMRTVESMVRSYREPPPSAAKPAAPSEAGQRGVQGLPRGPMTPAEEEARKKEQEAEAAKVGAAKGEMTAQVLNAGKASRGLVPIYETLDARVSKPGMDLVLGVFERPELLKGLGAIVEETFRVGNFSVGIPQIRALITNTINANELSAEARKAGVTPQDLIDNLAVIGQGLALTQFNQRQGLGSGTSVSNFEQQMVNAMGPNLKDTVSSFRQKLAFMKNKSEFEVQVADAMDEAGLSYSKFIRTPEYIQMEKAYREKQLATVYGPSGAPSGAAPAAAPAGGVKILKIEPGRKP